MGSAVHFPFGIFHGLGLDLSKDIDARGQVEVQTRPELEMPIDVNAVVLIALGSLLVGALPFYPYSRHWGYAPSVLLALLLLVMLVIALT